MHNIHGPEDGQGLPSGERKVQQIRLRGTIVYVNKSDGDAALRCSMSRHGLALVLLEEDPSGRAFVRMNGAKWLL